MPPGTIRLNSPTSIPIKHLRGAILREVSRSFYLSIRLLPAAVRDPIALAYLLARATDTIADTAEIDAATRRERLVELAALIQGQAAPPGAVESLRSFAALQKNAAERALLERLPECLEWLSALSEADRDDVRAVLVPINEGQRLDVERFRDPAHVVALATADELERYIYLVAGCVGEFWTRVCWRKLPQFSNEAREMMLEWGVAYGEALQLVNILRDPGTDLRLGRCYLPADELEVVGVTARDLRWNAARTEPVLRAWREQAELGIKEGIEYACAIRSWRVRLATALPALIGARTLALLRDAGPEVFHRRVKVERAEVRRTLLALVSRLAAPATIRALHARLSS